MAANASKNRDKLCPFCAVATAPHWTWQRLETEITGDVTYYTRWGRCNACAELIVQMGAFDSSFFKSLVGLLLKTDPFLEPRAWIGGARLVWFAHPRSYSRPIDSRVPQGIAEDYLEAAAVLDLSPKASAALSRRCLQHVIRENFKHLTSALKKKRPTLAEEIQVVLESGELPGYAAEALHDVREIGNFAAHPKKNESTGAIVDVEPGEAEWQLDTLDLLFDAVFVQPALLRERKAALHQKIEESKNKPE